MKQFHQQSEDVCMCINTLIVHCYIWRESIRKGGIPRKGFGIQLECHNRYSLQQGIFYFLKACTVVMDVIFGHI